MGVYSFQDVNATLVGPGISVTLSEGGVAEEGITTSMMEDKATMNIGADGDGQHSLHAGNGGTVTLRLQKTNPLNAVLGQGYTAQTSSSALYGQNIIVIRNPVLGDTITCTQCGFRKLPDNVNAKDAGNMEWVFNAIKIIEILGDGTPG